MRKWIDRFTGGNEAHTAGFYAVIVAVIAGAFLIAAAIVSRNDNKPAVAKPDEAIPDGPKPVLDLVSVRPQAVNRKSRRDGFDDFPKSEMATNVFELTNPSPTEVITVTRAEFIPSDIQKIVLDENTLMMTSPIDHKGHIEAWLNNPSVHVPVPIALHKLVGPGESTRFVIWFKSTTTPGIGLLVATGRLKVYFDDSNVLSKPFPIYIHSDSQEMHYGQHQRRHDPIPDDAIPPPDGDVFEGRDDPVPPPRFIRPAPDSNSFERGDPIPPSEDKPVSPPR